MDKNTQAIMNERFGKDSLIALATAVEGVPHVRTVDAYWLDGCFYVITHALSGKMQQIAANPRVALCGDWFTGYGAAENLGHVLLPEHDALMETLRGAFAAWYGNDHVNERDEHTVLLRIRVTDGVVFQNGERFAWKE